MVEQSLSADTVALLPSLNNTTHSSTNNLDYTAPQYNIHSHHNPHTLSIDPSFVCTPPKTVQSDFATVNLKHFLHCPWEGSWCRLRLRMWLCFLHGSSQGLDQLVKCFMVTRKW